MARYKQVPGYSYSVVGNNGTHLVLTCRYKCPYCFSNTSDTLFVPVENEPILNGGFWDYLTCDSCGEKANVRYWPSQRAE